MNLNQHMPLAEWLHGEYAHETLESLHCSVGKGIVVVQSVVSLEKPGLYVGLQMYGFVPVKKPCRPIGRTPYHVVQRGQAVRPAGAAIDP